jgi:hypothetical protein
MPTVLQSALAAITGVIGLIVYISIYNGLNTVALGTSATAILAVVPIVLSAVIVLGILGGFFALK